MKKFFLFIGILLSFGILFSEITIPEGSGTSGDPYQITSLENLGWINSNPSSWNSYFVQLNDIDASETCSWDNGQGWSPIGNGSIKFTGYYDGQGHIISGLYINRNESYQGFFGWVKEGEVHDLGLVDVDITGGNARVGGLAGAASYNFNDAIIYGCFATGTVSGTGQQVGGLIGWDFRCQVTNCYADCEVSGSESIGGLIGLTTNNTYVRRSFSKGSVSGSIDIGGLIGSEYQAYTSDSYSMAEVFCGENYGGGLIGHLYYNNSINNCYALGHVSGDGQNKGGLIGANDYGTGTVNSSFWDITTSFMANSFGGTPKPDYQMKNINTFTNLSTIGLDNPWDFVGDPNNDVQDNDYWDMDSNKNDGYPFLSWQTFNSPPFVATALEDFSFDEDTTNSSINLNNVFDDVDLDYGDILTFSYSGNTNIGVSISNGIVTLTPAENWNGSETITFTATDNSGETASDEVVVTINPVNDAPTIILPDSLTFNEDTVFTNDFTYYVNDIDSENLTLTASGNTNINVEITGFNVTFTATENWSGTENITFTINDNYSRAIASDNMNIIVDPVNDAPFVANAISDFSFDEDTTNSSINLNNVFDDVDLDYGDILTFSYSGNTNIGVSISNGIVTLTPAENWNGSETITFTATDNSGETASDEVVVTINPVNDAPTISNFVPEESSISLSEAATISFEITAEDIDSDLIYGWEINNENQNNETNTLNYNFGENGIYNVKCIVSDGEYQIEQNWVITLEIVDNNDNSLIPEITELTGNYPNPFSLSGNSRGLGTTIKYNLSKSGFVKIDIFNIVGQKIKTLINSNLKKGKRSVVWTGKNSENRKVSAGIYFYRLSVDNEIYSIRKCILLK